MCGMSRISSSILVVMSRSTSSADAPLQTVPIKLLLKEMSGKKSTGRCVKLTNPATMQTMNSRFTRTDCRTLKPGRLTIPLQRP
jgi:hypothetical protein